MKKRENVKKYKLHGCEGCTKSCQFNGKITEEPRKGSKYNCNNSK